MSRRRPGAQPTAVLTHPQEPTIKVTVRKSKRIEAMRFGEKLAMFQRATLVYDKDGKTVETSPGQPMTIVQPTMPVDMIIESLRMHVTGWEGIIDQNDQTIGYSTDSIPTLIEDWLDVDDEIEIEETDKATGVKTTVKKPVKKMFGRWISEQIAKGEIFDTDPKTSGSAKL